jgi:hypothetical protein
LSPALTVMEASLGMPSVNREVFGNSSIELTAVAGAPLEPEALEEALFDDDVLDELLDEVDEVEDVVELPDWVCCSSAWIAAVSAVLVRFNAVWLAMLAKPWDSLVTIEPIALINESVLAIDWSRCCDRFQ